MTPLTLAVSLLLTLVASGQVPTPPPPTPSLPLPAWDLPVLPASYHSVSAASTSNSDVTHLGPFREVDRKIPRHVWISMKTVPPAHELPPHIRRLMARESKNNWTVHLEDNAAQAQFMQRHFANTSTLWAFSQISPRIGNAASDIWRYSLLLLWGGVYLDDDSYIEASFESMVQPNDSIILTKEPNAYSDECYRDSFHMSDASLVRRFPVKNRVQDINGGRTLVSWAVFAAPRHPFIVKTLSNIVELIRLEYLRQSALKLRYYDHKWKVVMCTTGPTVLTVSVKQVLLEHPELAPGQGQMSSSSSGVRIEKRDFADYGGVFKLARANGTERGHDHYMHTMQYYHALLLRSYRPVHHHELQDKLLTLERSGGEDPGRYFLMMNGSLRAFESVQHLSLYGFTERAAVVLDAELYAALPKGPVMAKDDGGAGGSVIGLGVARLENKLVAIINRRSKRSYYMIANATSYRFLDWDHFSSFNFSVDDAIPINDAFFAKIPPAVDFYRLPLAQALENKLIVTPSRAYYFVQLAGKYCTFADFDHFKGSVLSHKVHDAVAVTAEMLQALTKGDQCP